VGIKRLKLIFILYSQTHSVTDHVIHCHGQAERIFGHTEWEKSKACHQIKMNEQLKSQYFLKREERAILRWCWKSKDCIKIALHFLCI